MTMAMMMRMPMMMTSWRHYALGGEAIEVGGAQRRLRIIGLQVERRLVVDDDEENVGPA
jgi:hypothetical protein